MRRVPVDLPLLLDASISYDEDSAPGGIGGGLPTAGVTALNFTWSCTVASLKGFGTCAMTPLEYIITNSPNQLSPNH